MALLVLLSASCAKDALEKADAEAAFAQKQNLPTVSIANDVKNNPAEGTVEVTITVNGTSGLQGLEIGMLSSRTSDFSSTDFIEAENAGDGTYKVKAKAYPGQMNFFKACVSCTSGSAFSDAISFDVPDVKFIYKAAGTFTAKAVADAWGDPHDFEITIVPDADDPEHKCQVLNLSPFFAENGFVASKGKNIFDGEVDCDNFIITIPSYQLVGYQTCFLISFTDDSMEVEDDLKLYFNSDGDKIMIDNVWGIYQDGNGWWDLYLDPFILTKK